MIAINEPVAELVSTTDATSYAMTVFTPAANATLVVFVQATGTVAAGSMTGGSLTWTKKDSQVYNTVDTQYVFWANTGPSPASTTITFNCTGDAATGCVMLAFQCTGTDLQAADPIRQVAKNTGAATGNPTVTFASALLPSNGYCYGIGSARTTPGITPPTNWTETADSGYGTPAAGGAGAYRATGESGTQIATIATSHTWGMMAVEVNASASSLIWPVRMPCALLAR